MRIGIMSAAVLGAEQKENRMLIEEIEAQDHQAVIINYVQNALGVLHEGRLTYKYDSRDNLEPIEVDAVIPRIGSNVDEGVRALTLLTSKNIYSTVSPEAVRVAKDKMLTSIILDAAGIPVPYSIAPAKRRPKKNLLPTLHKVQPDPDGMSVVKQFTGSHGKGVFRGNNEENTIQHVESLGTGPIPLRYMFQEFATDPEPDVLASDVRIIVREGIMIAAMKRQAKNKREFRSNLAQDGKGLIYEPTDREVELATKSCEILNVPFGGVDIIPSQRGSLVCEVNVSPQFGIQEITGINVAKALVDLAIRNAESRHLTIPVLHEEENQT